MVPWRNKYQKKYSSNIGAEIITNTIWGGGAQDPRSVIKAPNIEPYYRSLIDPFKLKEPCKGALSSYQGPYIMVLQTQVWDEMTEPRIPEAHLAIIQAAKPWLLCLRNLQGKKAEGWKGIWGLGYVLEYKLYGLGDHLN